jgi:hypothetical protein
MAARQMRTAWCCSKAPVSVAAAWPAARPISSFATLIGAWTVKDPSGTNVVHVVLSGTERLTPEHAVSMPAFGAYSDSEIAALAN